MLSILMIVLPVILNMITPFILQAIVSKGCFVSRYDMGICEKDGLWYLTDTKYYDN